MLEVEVLGASLAPGAPRPPELRRLCTRVAASMGVEDGHVAIEFVGAARIARLNAEHRNRRGPTDVLSFPIDGGDTAADGRAPGRPRQTLSADQPPRELGDVVICPECAEDLREAIVHGMLHLLGMDHESDQGEMLALQRTLLAEAGG